MSLKCIVTKVKDEKPKYIVFFNGPMSTFFTVTLFCCRECNRLVLFYFLARFLLLNKNKNDKNYQMQMKTSTPAHIVFGETGHFPLYSLINCGLICDCTNLLPCPRKTKICIEQIFIPPIL